MKTSSFGAAAGCWELTGAPSMVAVARMQPMTAANTRTPTKSARDRVIIRKRYLTAGALIDNIVGEVSPPPSGHPADLPINPRTVEQPSTFAKFRKNVVLRT